MKYLVGALWVNVFIIMWLQMLKIIDLWPSTFYLIMLGIVGIGGAMMLFGNDIKEKDTEGPPKEIPGARPVKGIK